MRTRIKPARSTSSEMSPVRSSCLLLFFGNGEWPGANRQDRSGVSKSMPVPHPETSVVTHRSEDVDTTEGTDIHAVPFAIHDNALCVWGTDPRAINSEVRGHIRPESFSYLA